MSRSKLPTVTTEDIYFITTSVNNRIKLLTHQPYVDVLMKSLIFLSNEGETKIYGFVIMPDHIHLIMKSKISADIMRRFKSYTARNIIDYCISNHKKELLSSMKLNRFGKQQHQFWEKSYHPVAICREEMFRQKLNYIHQNPVKKGLVDRAVDYCWSSALMYEKGLVGDGFCRNAYLNPDDFIR